MARLYYGADYGTISVRADDDPSDREIELTAEQALAMAAWHIAQSLGSMSEGISDLSINVSALSRKES